MTKTAGSSFRLSVALLLLVTGSVRSKLPPYDFSGHWEGEILAAGSVFPTSADLTSISAKKFGGTATVSGVSCQVKGKRKRKVRIVLECEDGTKAKLTGALDVAANALAGLARVSKSGRHARGTFGLAKAVTAPAVCGDGALDAGEQCDDGNTAAGDGCGATCVVEVATDVSEVEPNDHPADAMSVAPLPALVHGEIAPVGDMDFYRIDVAGGDLVLETFDAGGSGTCVGTAGETDTYIELWGTDGITVLAQNDDDPLRNGYCSRVELHGLAPGIYYPCVRGTLGSHPAYALVIR